MTTTYTIEVTRQPADADDTAGHGVIVEYKQLSGRLFQIAPGAAIRLTLPDPAPVDTKGLDVKGFLSAEAQENDVEGHLWMLLPIVVGGFYVGYGAVSFYRNEVETHEVPRNPKGGGNSYDP